jgi:hypothetical protein
MGISGGGTFFNWKVLNILGRRLLRPIAGLAMTVFTKKPHGVIV